MDEAVAQFRYGTVETGTNFVVRCRVGRIPERRRWLPDDVRREIRQELERVWSELHKLPDDAALTRVERDALHDAPDHDNERQRDASAM